MAKRKKIFDFKISATNLLTLVSSLKTHEAAVGLLPNNLSNFFGNNMTEKGKDDFITLNVKTIICEEAGLTILPLKLPDKVSMDRFAFNDIQNLRLAQRFTEIARVFKPEALIGRSEVEDCDTVGDCVQLVKDKS